jgi:hypothetical protein
MLNRTAKDTEVTTRPKKMPADMSPGRVIINGPADTTGSPGETKLKSAGMAISSEKKGMKIQVRFRKKPSPILENSARIKHKR